MTRLIPWTCATILAVFSLSTFAAELGKLTVMSALGQPLRAEIELAADQANELDSLSARIAPAQDLRQTGIERSSVLMNLRFSVERKKAATAILKLSTVQPVNEPFLYLPIELNWPSGRQIHEYTVLLDPPGYVEPQAAQPVAAPTIDTAREETSARPLATPPEEDMKADTAASAASEQAPVAAATAPAETKADSVGAMKSRFVKKGDTLIAIARELKPEGISLEQMLVALYQANKQAFVGNNMNRLKTGHILRVPEAPQIAATGRADAAREFKAQTADWNAYRRKLAAAVASTPSPKDAAPTQAARGKITTEIEEKGAPPAPSQDVLKVSKSNAGAKEKQVLQERLTSLSEENTAGAKAVQEANERIATLEKSVKDMEHLLDLKNKSLAEMQSRIAPATPTGTVVPRPERVAVTPAADGQETSAATKQPAPARRDANGDSSRKTLYFSGGIVALFALGGGVMLIVNGQRKKSIYADQSLSTFYRTAA